MKPIITDSTIFKDFRQRDGYYVDKTKEIIEFFELKPKVILLPRPRRFGKTMFLSTIKYLFSIKDAEDKLFEGTYVYNTEFFKKHFKKYPVIHLTFKDIKEPDFEMMYEKTADDIRGLCISYKEVLDLKYSQEYDEHIQRLQNIIDDTATQKDYEKSLKSLTILLTAYYKKPPIVLIDEYDTPIIQSYFKGYYEKAIDFFRNILSAVFKENDLNITKGLITGILRVSGESMFSGLNNLETYTILEDTLSTACGFTREETEKLLDDYEITGEERKNALIWYNSYNIGNKVITNPWSILNFVDKRRLEPYWANTASNDLIYDMIEKSPSFQKELEKILKVEPIDVRVNKNITFKSLELYKRENLFSLLFFAGYLKCEEKYIKRVKVKEGYREYLHCKMIPANIECQMIFEIVISDYVRESFKNQDIDDLLQALTSGNIKLFEKLFSYILRDTVSYFDTKNENSYHMFLLGVLTNLSGDYEIISNSEAGYGRVDIVLLHKEDKSKPAIVMELKEIDEFEDETKDKALQRAVEQIKKKEYVTLAKKRGYSNIIAFGLVFDGKRCWVKRLNKG